MGPPKKSPAIAAIQLAPSSTAGRESIELVQQSPFRKALLPEHLPTDARSFPQQAKQNMLRSNLRVSKCLRGCLRQLEDFVRPGREGKIVVGSRSARAGTHSLHDGPAHAVRVDVQRAQGARGDPLRLRHESERQMFGADILVAQTLRLVARQRQ